MAIVAERQKKILDILENLPPEKIDEIIDFAEYLKGKKGPSHGTKKKTLHPKLPTFHLGRMMKHALQRDQIYKGYLDRKFD